MQARQTADAIHFRIQNKSNKIVILGDPEKSGVIIKVDSNKMSGGLESSIHGSSDPWKHLIVLAPNRENKPHTWTHEFVIPTDRESVGIIKRMDIRIWYSNAEEFKIETFGPLKTMEFDVRILAAEPE